MIRKWKTFYENTLICNEVKDFDDTNIPQLLSKLDKFTPNENVEINLKGSKNLMFQKLESIFHS